MGKLDFSGINKIAYKHFEDKPGERDSLLQAGFTIVEDVELPFSAEPEASAPQPTGFTDHTGKVDYEALYKAAYDFHKRNSPPVVDLEYWKDHMPGKDERPEKETAYLDRVSQEISSMVSEFHNAPLAWGMCHAIMRELEREYKEIRDSVITSL